MAQNNSTKTRRVSRGAVNTGFRRVSAGSGPGLSGSSGGGGGLAPIVGETLAELNAGSPLDGQPGVLRLANGDEVDLRYNSTGGVWRTDPATAVTQQDSWAMDLGNKSAAVIVDWAEINNAVPYGKSHALLNGSHNLSASNFNVGTATGVLTVDDTTSPHSFAFQATSAGSPYLQIADNYISYTGKTGTTFTGCAVVQGSRGTVPNGMDVVQGYSGGWGFVIVPIINAASMYAAGFTLEERLVSLMNSAPGEVKITMAPYWFQVDPGDAMPARTEPPTNGMGVSASLQSLNNTGGTLGGERNFYLTENGWTDFPLADPVSETLIPMMVGKMASAGLTGSVLDTRLEYRWRG